MRRGLLTWDSNELPVAVLEARIARLRAAMKAQGIDAFVAYTNIAKPAAVSWTSGFTPYWSEGLLYVPAEGEPAFATALSKRVAEWISTVMPKGEIIPTPQPGVAISKRLAASGAKRVGMPDLEDVPSRQVKDLLAGAPGVDIVDATDLFNTIRSEVDDAERGLVRKAAEIASAAMQKVHPGVTTAQELIAPCEGYARAAAAEEIFLACVPDLSKGQRFQRTDTAGPLGDTFALRISLAYKAGWVRLAKSFARDAALQAQYEAADTALAGLDLSGSRDIESSIRAALEPAGVTLRSWSVEQPRGSYPLVTVAASATPASSLRAGAPATINVDGEIAGARWIASRPLV